MAVRKEAHLIAETPPRLVSSATSSHGSLAMILGALRADREARGLSGMSRQAFADQLGLTWAGIDKFEQGASASAEMLLSYPRLLGLSMDEMEELADRMASNVSSLVYDRRVDPLERAMIADRLVRAESDGFAKNIRELIDGPCGTRTHDSLLKRQKL